MTAVVGDASAPRRLFEELFGARAVQGLPAGPPEQETTVDLAIGDVVLRLVEPRSERSRYSAAAAAAVASAATACTRWPCASMTSTRCPSHSSNELATAPGAHPPPPWDSGWSGQPPPHEQWYRSADRSVG